MTVFYRHRLTGGRQTGNGKGRFPKGALGRYEKLEKSFVCSISTNIIECIFFGPVYVAL